MKIINGVIVEEGAASKSGSVRAYGARGDDLQNDTAAIQAALDNLSIVHFPPGIYRCNGLVIPAGRTLRSDGNATLLVEYAGATNPYGLIIRGSGVVLDGLTITGSVNRWGVYIDLEAGDLNNITIRHCTMLDLNRGIAVRSASALNRTLRNLTVSGCTLQNLANKAIDLLVSINGSGVAYSLENIHIERNHFEDVAPNSSGKGDAPGTYSGAIYIGGLTSIKRFYLRDNVVYRAAPQFLAMSATTNPRVDFLVSGNTVKQEGTQVVVNMSYTFNNVDNLIFDRNTCDHVDYEHLFLRNCRNFKVSNSHFSRANVGIAIHDRTPTERSYGEVIGCTFEDIECPTAENSGNKGVFLTSDVAEVDFANCRFSKRSGTKGQVGIELNYFTNPAPAPRLGMTVSNCQFEGITGIVTKSGGSIAMPGHARVTGCSFKKCNVGISFTFAVGNVVAYCVFEDGNIDVWGRFDVAGLRCLHNLHRNTNAAGTANAGAYVVAVGNGKSIWQVEGCTFRNVKNMHVLESGSFLAGQRVLVWANNDVDASSTGPPPVSAAVVGAL